MLMFVFFYTGTSTAEIYTLSLHDALPICDTRAGARRVVGERRGRVGEDGAALDGERLPRRPGPDRKSTRLNSSHGYISYAVFCLKKKKPANIVDVANINC